MATTLFRTLGGRGRKQLTGITVYLLNGALLQYAQQMAAHESPRTTMLYDRTGNDITLNEVERIRI